MPLCTVQSFTQCLYVQYSPLLNAFMYSTALYSVSLCTVQSFTQCLYVQYSPLLSAFMYSTVLYSMPLCTVQPFTQCLYVQYSPLLNAFMYSTALYSMPLCTVQSFTQCLYVVLRASPNGWRARLAFMYSTVIIQSYFCKWLLKYAQLVSTPQGRMQSRSSFQGCGGRPPNSWASCLGQVTRLVRSKVIHQVPDCSVSCKNANIQLDCTHTK